MRRPVLIWLQLQVLVAGATDAGRHDDNYTAPSVINVGLLQPLEGEFGFEMTGSAATMAVRDAQQRGYLNNTDVRCGFVSSVWSDFRSQRLTPSLSDLQLCYLKRFYLPYLVNTAR